MKTSNGVPPRRVQVPGPIASLNDGPQASLIKTLDGFADATGTSVKTAAATTAATPDAVSRLRTDPPFSGPQTFSDAPPWVNGEPRIWRAATKWVARCCADRDGMRAVLLAAAAPAASRWVASRLHPCGKSC